ncbi:MAG: phosphoenolpyruvate carboxykinase domain-containing protein [Comamonadaceae bacterium]|nr:phosphoenolpyruvate carboxykinase domain-containing protein [Comamonadaceae bacterium]
MIVPPKGFDELEGRSPSATTSPGSSRRRRHAARHQPRGRLLRRGAGHLLRVQPQWRWTSIKANCHLHQRRADRRRRRLVGRHGTGAAGARASTGRATTGRPDCGTAGGAPERPLHRARRAVPDHRPRVGGSRGRADLAPSSSAAGCPRPFPLVYRGLRLEPRRVHGGHHGLGGHRRGHRPGGHPPRSVRHAAVLPATTWPTTWGHWLNMGKQVRPQAAADLPRQLVPQGRRTASSSGRATGENMRVLKWIVDRVNGQVGAVESPFGLDAALRGSGLGRAEFLQGAVPADHGHQPLRAC